MLKLSASSAGRLMECPGAANLEEAIPGFVTPPPVKGGMADEGSKVHSALEVIFSLTPKNTTRVLQCFAEIQSLRETRRFKILSEETVECEWLPSKPETTADLVFYLKGELHIIDLKWGAIEVELDDNWQLFFYAKSYLHFAPEAKEVYLWIAQPKAGGLQCIVVTREEVEEFALRAIEADERITRKDLTLVPNNDCTFCPANPHTRGPRGNKMCPEQSKVLYPDNTNEEAMLNEYL